jgi:hypothetical protein
MTIADILTRAGASRENGQLDEAVALYRQAADLMPEAPEAHHYLGWIFASQGRFEEAESAFRAALERAPDAPASNVALADLLLADGRYVEGFARFEARHAIARMAKPNLPFAEWRGEPVDGRKLLIWPEQGFGDQIQFARFAPILRDRGASVTLLCAPPLTRLFAGCLDGVKVEAASGAVDFDAPDYWVMTCSLAARMQVEVRSIPAEPYLHALEPAPAMPAGFRVGLAANGSPDHPNDANRSLPPDQAHRLRSIPGVHVVDLDPAASGARDFADTAAIMSGLDLVISVDTAAAHLAGAMGKPCWLLLPAVSVDWRWLRGREDSPWYPTTRIFRQDRGEPRSRLVDRVVRAVEESIK